MILITKNKDEITIEGHSMPDVCASCSSIMYTIVNCLLNYDNSSITFKDVNDVVNIKINKHDDVINILLKTMVDMFNDLSEQSEGQVKIKNID